MTSQTARPQDHRLPKDAPRHVSVRGIEFDVDPNVFEDLYDIQNSDNDPNGAFKIIPLLRKLLGDDAYRQAKRVLRDPDTGRIGMETVAGFLTEVMGQASLNS